MNIKQNNKKGFTLIELLIVIAIIGILASILLVQFGGSRASARDAKRISAIQQLTTALEMYYNTYGQYPRSRDSGTDPGWDHSGVGDGFIKGLQDNTRGDNVQNIKFLSRDPVDPSNKGNQTHCGGPGNDLYYVYITVKSRQGYRLCFSSESGNDYSANGLVRTCNNGDFPVYCVNKNWP